MVDIVQCYDPVEDTWAKTFSLPAALGGIRACTLTILPSFANLRSTPTQSSRTSSSTGNVGGDSEGAGKRIASIALF